MASTRRRLPPGARWVTLPSGVRRVELVVDIGTDPATGKRRQTRRRYATVDAAVAAYNEIKSEARQGTYVGRSAVTVAQLCADWLAGRRVRPSTLAGYRDVLKPVVGAYGALPAQRLTKKHITDLIDRLVAGDMRRADGRTRRPWSGRTVNLMLFTLGQVLDDASRQGLLVRNVAALVDRLPQTKKEMLTFTPAEVRQVLAAAREDRMEPAWHLALYGLRRGEIGGLAWSDIDLKSGTLTTRETNLAVEGKSTKGTPKTKRGERTLPLTPALVTVFKRAKRRQAAERLRLGAKYAASGYVVVNEAGEQIHPDTITDRWEQLLAAAGVRRIRLHDARHTCGTLMHLEGVPTAVIAAWLGHADAAFTMRTYVHSQDDALKAAARTLGSVTSA